MHWALGLYSVVKTIHKLPIRKSYDYDGGEGGGQVSISDDLMINSCSAHALRHN